MSPHELQMLSEMAIYKQQPAQSRYEWSRATASSERKSEIDHEHGQEQNHGEDVRKPYGIALGDASLLG
jgi:hypothetical protein